MPRLHLKCVLLGSLLVLLGSLLAAFGPLLAQDTPAPRDAARARARRILHAVEAAYQASERFDVRGALGYLRDEDWLVRRYGLVRLAAVGLPDERAQAWQPFSRPGSTPAGPEADAAMTLIAAWVEEEAARTPMGMEEIRIEPIEAAIGVAGIAREFIRPGIDIEEVRRLVDLHAALAEELEERVRLDFVRLFLPLVDAETLARDLGIRGELRRPDVPRVLDWYWQNRAYLYFHPVRRAFLIDADARAVSTPSDAYRRAHPFPPGEGPDAPPPTEGPGR